MKNKIINIFIDILYLSIGILAIITSIKFSYQFLLYNGHNKLWSIVIAIIYIVFLNLIFEYAIGVIIQNNKLKRERNKHKDKTTIKKFNRVITKKYCTAYTILFVWFLLIFYSIISTVGGQYDQLVQIEKNNPEIRSNNSSNISIIQEKIKTLKDRKQSYKLQISNIIKRLSSIEDVEKSYTYKNTSAKNEQKLEELEIKLENIDDEIFSLQDELASINLNSSKISDGNVYTYFERAIKLPAFLIQFILSFYPSLVLDFFSPISFAMFIYRRRKQ